ncbi:MAG TPA: helical backbone metal receptor [Candidatus Deferrimicrobiaceae bacterium]|nr:helical backbone metal receptor [Candidatus Deferrimicrobiaceae bacterium]
MAAASRRGRRAVPMILLLSLVAAACAPASPSTSPLPTTGSTPASSSTAPAPSPTAPAFPLTLVDDEGTDVTIAARPERIVSLTPATTEILFAIGAGPRVVAKVEDVADYPPEAAGLPVVATFAGVDVEAIVALEADLVVAGGSGLSQGPAVEQLRNAGIAVLVSYPITVDGALEGIRTIGLAAGEAQAAQELARSMAFQIEAIREATTNAERPRVFYEIDYGQAIFTPPADSIYGEMIRLAGGDPISGDPGYAISIETLVAADPQVILLGDAAYGVTAEQVAARPGWADMTAVVEGRIHPVDDILITRPGPRLVQGLRELLRAIHPELLDGLPLPSLDKLPLPSGDPEQP